jgi:stage IV sporulation protein FB
VYAHWSVLLVGAYILFRAIDQPREAFVVLVCYFGVMLIHECGHLILAHRKGCKVRSIQLYAIYGITLFDEPWSRRDLSEIAWGGVLAQASVAIPIYVWVAIFGFTRYGLVNIAFVMLGFFSLFIAALNLIPIAPLDGKNAWYLFYIIYDNARFRRELNRRRR